VVQKETRFHVYKDWSERLGCDFSDMNIPNVIVRQHSKTLERYSGIYCFYNGTSCIISAPAIYVRGIDVAVRGSCPKEAFDANLLTKMIGSDNYQVIGPAFQGYNDLASFKESTPLAVVDIVTEQQRDLILDLRKSCSEVEWEQSDIDYNRQPIMARICDEKVVAAGSWRVEVSGFLSIGIISHPDYRGSGHAKAVVNALTSKGLKTGAIMHYQTLKSNTSSVAIAHSLGYQELACTLAIKLSD
jgi:hypothetical protein